MMHLMLLIAGGIIFAIILLCMAPVIIGGVIWLVVTPISWIASLCFWVRGLFKKK